MLTVASLIPSHDVAHWLIGIAESVCRFFGLPADSFVVQVGYILLVGILALSIGYIFRFIAVKSLHHIIRKRASDVAKAIVDNKVIARSALVIPPIVIIILLPLAFDSTSSLLSISRNLAYVYLAIMIGVAANAIIALTWHNYNVRINRNNHPLKGVMNIAKGVVWIIVAIVGISILIHKSPLALLGGLGAFAAALMLIFKDSLLGFVAGLQLSSNDMLRVGDWIVVPSTIANGIVVDVSLTVVKVQNWDNTIVMLPPYSLVSAPFQNWRGMSDSGVRQIDRSIIIDTTTIIPITPELLDIITEKVPELRAYVARRKEESDAGHPMVFNGGTAPVNGTIDTNLGLLRAYLCSYLLNHPAIAHDQNIIVRIMPVRPEGTPLDIYCFTSTTDWLAYEAICSQLLEHLISISPIFSLRLTSICYI